MENLNLCVEGKLIHSIPREDIGIELDFSLLTQKLLDELVHYDWLIEHPIGNDIRDLPFKETYMAECAYLIWGYNLKQEIKKFL